MDNWTCTNFLKGVFLEDIEKHFKKNFYINKI